MTLPSAIRRAVCGKQLGAGQAAMRDRVRLQVLGDLLVAVPRAQIGVGPRLAAGLLLERVVQVVGDPDRATGIAGRGLDEQLLDRGLADHAAVGHAVQRHPAGHAEVGEPGLAVDVAHHPQHDLLADLLHRGRDVELALRHPGLGLARRPPEEVAERAVGHGQAVVVREVLHVELERAVLVQVDHVAHDPLEVDGLPVGRQPHHLVLGAVDLEPQVVREGAVEQAQRVGEPDLLEQRDVGAAAHAEAGGRPLADAVHGEDRRFLEGRDEENTRRRGSCGARRTGSGPCRAAAPCG